MDMKTFVNWMKEYKKDYYLKLKEGYDKYVSLKNKENSIELKIGDKVRTIKGGREIFTDHYKYIIRGNKNNEYGPFSGEIIKFTKWKKYKAAVIKKDKDGRKVCCLLKNLVRL